MDTLQSLLASPLVSVGVLLLLIGALGIRPRRSPVSVAESQYMVQDGGLVSVRTTYASRAIERRRASARRFFAACIGVGFAMLMLGIWEVKVGPLPWSGS
jgi:hypothetical protein